MAAVPGELLLDAAAHLVDRGEPEPGDVEGVQHPHRVRQMGAQRGGVAAERVQRGGGHTGPPAGVTLGDPAAQRRAAAVGDHIQQPCAATPAASQVHDPGDEPGRPPGGRGGERGLVHPDRRDLLQPARVIHQRPAVVTDRGHDRAPADPELAGHRRHRLTVATYPQACHGAGPLGHRGPRRDRLAGLRPGHHLAQPVAAAPDPLDPDQRHRPTRAGQIPHPHRAPIMQLRDRATARAADQIGRGLDGLLELALILRHGQQHEPGQTQQHRRRTTLNLHLGPPSPSVCTPRIVRSQAPLQAQAEDRVVNGHKRGEEHRIVQQHIDAGQPGRQHQQLRRQQRLPQRHRIVSSVRCGRRSTATVNVARRKRSCPCSKPLATCCPIVLTYGRSLCWSGRPVRGKRTISRILERLVGRGNSTELEGFRSPRLQPPPPPDLAYPQM